MDISSQLPRLPLLDLQTHSPTRPSSAISEVLGDRERIDAIVRHVVKLEASIPADTRSGQQQRQELYRLVLQVENRNIEALTNRPLQPGQQLGIRLAANGQVQVVTVDGKPVRAGPTPPSAAASRPVLDQLVDALRQNLPRQEPSGPLLRTLAEVLRSLTPATGRAPQAPAQAAGSRAESAAGPTATPAKPSASGPGPTATRAPESAPAPAPASNIPRLPPAVTEALTRLAQALPTRTEVTDARGLQRAVRDSGIFLEPRLAQALRENGGAPATQARSEFASAVRNAIQGDQKANLLRAYAALEQAVREHALPGAPRGGPPLTPEQALRVLSAAAMRAGASPPASPSSPAQGGAPVRGETTAPPQLAFPAPVAVPATGTALPAGGSLDLALSVLLRQVAAAISRITVQQVQSTAVQQGGGAEPGVQNSWQVELPVRLADGAMHVFQLQIDEEAQGGGAEGEQKKVRQWKVTLAFDLAPLGPMYAQIRLREQTVATRFWAEQPATLQAVRAELDTLKQKLVALGLQVEELDCLAGAPPARGTAFSRQLVDVRT